MQALIQLQTGDIAAHCYVHIPGDVVHFVYQSLETLEKRTFFFLLPNSA